MSNVYAFVKGLFRATPQELPPKQKKAVPYFLSVDYLLAQQTQMHIQMARNVAQSLMTLRPDKSSDEIRALVDECVASIEAAGLRARKEAAEKGIQ